MDACSVPLNGVATLLVACEMLTVVPSALTARKTAEPWNPAAHATSVAQVGVLDTGPVGGTSATWPGFVPTVAWAASAPRSRPPTVPAVTPSTSAVRPSRPALSDFSFRQYIGVPFLERFLPLPV